jgi:quinol monooxygenase YgiN
MSFAVCVTFAIDPKHLDAFLPLMHANAQTSQLDEPGCQRFDVLTDPTRPGDVFLYELYDDAAAFQAHLASPHFKRFDQAVAAMIVTKDIKTYEVVMS